MANYHDELNYTGAVIGIILTTLLSVIIVYDIVSKCKKVEDNLEDKTKADMKILIYVTAISTLFHMIGVVLGILVTKDDTSCKWRSRTSTVMFHISRCSLYVIFVRRLQIAYSHPIFNLNRINIYVMYTIIAFYFFPYVLYIDWTAVHSTYDKAFDGCLTEFDPPIVVIIVFLLDIILSIYCLILFIRPIRRIANAEESQSVELYYIITKSAVLVSVACISSLISPFFLMSFGWGYLYLYIDDFINVVVILLVHPIHEKIYMIVCGALHNCCMLSCYLKKKIVEIKMEQQLEISSPSSAVSTTDKTSSTN